MRCAEMRRRVRRGDVCVGLTGCLADLSFYEVTGSAHCTLAPYWSGALEAEHVFV